MGRIALTRKRSATAVAMLGCLASLLVATGGSAQAAPSHHGKDPLASGCNIGARTLSSARLLATDGQDYGYIEMRYSPSCQTQWIRVKSTISNCDGSQNDCLQEISVRRPSGADGGAASFTDYRRGPTAFGRMVYTPNTRACGTAAVDLGTRHAYPSGVPGREICG
ncbi:DUF2690 domain-containing protein [Streptomyces sedi]|uniref:DUF2690 domain-containing protein n=1 Tax=Streptomyces sedi TaxID=555059 RepID=A0A5C4VCX6_9ACTN|nr:DUF2690 domain-containing protein [Streptomyces sedi]TNM33652.1 DUF2690 domain-containing protein [Streptomyces sedi]